MSSPKNITICLVFSKAFPSLKTLRGRELRHYKLWESWLMATPSPCFLPTLVAPEQWWVLKSLTIMESSLPHGFLEWHIGYLCNFHLHGEFSGCNYPLQLIKSDVITEVLLAVPLHIQVGVCGSLEFQSWALLTRSPTHCCRLGESFLRWHSHSLLQHTLWGASLPPWAPWLSAAAALLTCSWTLSPSTAPGCHPKPTV